MRSVSKALEIIGSVVIVVAFTACSFVSDSFSDTKQAPVSKGTGNFAKVHVVQPGDTLYSIAQKYGSDPEKIAKENGITDPSQMKVGQQIGISVGSSN